MLGLCFGAYELLGVFQGCFHNEHPLPYQPHNHLNSGDSKDESDEAKEKSKEQLSDNELEGAEVNEDGLEESKSGPCSCYSTSDDVFDDDTRRILQNSRRLIERKRFILEKPISKFTVSTSLMSLNRDESNLFNYIDDISNHNKFRKFKGEDEEIAETSFDDITSSRVYNDYRKKKRRNSSDLAFNRKHNEQSETSSSVNVDINKTKIFFISAAT